MEVLRQTGPLIGTSALATSVSKATKYGFCTPVSTTTGRPLSVDRQRLSINHVLCSIGQLGVGVYDMKSLKANTLQSLPEHFCLEAGALWSGEVLLALSGRHDGSKKYAFVLADHVHPYMRTAFPKDGIYQ
ncbi:hypothetical protein TNCV_3110211 [Trichonephila clavipes]|nr:hypothetical protein TNCV_3110211 [Trichonephila clavipes]